MPAVAVRDKAAVTSADRFPGCVVVLGALWVVFFIVTTSAPDDGGDGALLGILV